jgi:hypothetical protein
MPSFAPWKKVMKDENHGNEIEHLRAVTKTAEGKGVGMTVNLRGKVSWFGGPEDMGVSPSEGLAFIYHVDTAPHLFLATQPVGTTGLARRLNPSVPFIACRWNYDVHSKEFLASMKHVALVTAPKTGRRFRAWPADWGPHETTGRVADISFGLMEYLGIETDDEVEVEFPAPARTPRHSKVMV